MLPGPQCRAWPPYVRTASCATDSLRLRERRPIDLHDQ
jgi:hypothetical protein